MTSTEVPASLMANIMQTNLSMAFILFVAANVFYDDSNTDEPHAESLNNLHFLTTALEAIKNANPITASFQTQLDSLLRQGGGDSWLTTTNTGAQQPIEIIDEPLSASASNMIPANGIPSPTTTRADKERENLCTTLEAILPVQWRKNVTFQYQNLNPDTLSQGNHIPEE